ncbi:MAG: T9SS type A sorting domain-containing protein [Taibaiella sp.]
MKIFTKKSLIYAALCAVAPFLNSVDSYAQPTSTLTVGTGTTSGYLAPLYSCYGYSYTQQIYTAAQIIAANGGVAPSSNTITKIRFFSNSSSTTTTAASNGWTIYMGSTATSTFASNTSWVPLASMSQVFTGTVTFPAPGNWVELVLATPFVWDGTSNIVVAVDENVASWNCTLYWNSTVTTGAQTIYYYNDYTNPDPASPPTAGGTTTTRPNIQFEFLVSPNNAGVSDITVPQLPFCSGIQEVSAVVHNYGSNIINNVNVNWSIDGVLQAPVTLSTAIDMENTTAGPEATVVLGDVNFDYTVPKLIKAWTSMPNSVADTKPVNDSSAASITAALLGINDLLISPQDTTICSGETIVLNAGVHPQDPIYIWNNGQLTPTINVSQPGTYSVKVQNTDGCFDRDTITVTVYPDPVVNSIAIIDNGDGTFTFNVIGAQNIDSYTWSFGDGSNEINDNGMPGQQIHGYTVPGSYTVTLTLRNECGEVVVTRVVTISAPTGIDDVSALQKEISVYPNPSKSKVIIANKANIKMMEISIVNLMGQQVYKNDKINAVQVEINTTGFAAGIYNVMINTEKGMVTKKLEIIN